MSKKKILFCLLFLVGIAIYFVFFQKDKALKFIPEKADMVVLVDVKKLKRESFFSFISHPSQWFESSDIKSMVSSLNNSGIKKPDFLQIFHLKNSPLFDWYVVLEIDDEQKFLEFLKKRKFISKGNRGFQKDNLFIKLQSDKCFFGTSIAAFKDLELIFNKDENRKIYNAADFIKNTLASLSFISPQKKRNFGVELNEDEIEIKNTTDSKIFSPIISQLKKKNHFLDIELDGKNSRNFAEFFNFKHLDSAQISGLKAVVNLETVNDTIISYTYDDNFNEIEKKTFQKITQPNYIISSESVNPEKTWEYLKNKKWINAENQMTAIPFQPNLVSQNGNIFTIKSLRKPLAISKSQNENYIYLKNSNLLNSLLVTLSASEKKMLSKIETVFYGNRNADYLVKIKFKKGELPLIFKW